MGKRTRQERPMLLVSGFFREARIASGPGVLTVCGNASLLNTLLSGPFEREPRAVISFGIAGGLDPSLRSGQVVVASRIVSKADTWDATPHLASALVAQLGRASIDVRHGGLAGVDAPILTPSEKATLRHATGADAVDMESHVAAAYAAANGLPFCALRIIADSAICALPPVAVDAIAPDGYVDVRAVLASLMQNPAQILALIRTGRDARTAFAALRRCRGLLDFRSGFGLVDF